jgi:uncharacterized delta-60 repeat protein
MLLFATSVLAAGGTLDSTFGSNGVVTTKFNGTPSTARDIALQTDGKIIILGDSQSGKIITRYNSNGSVDNTFGINGITPIEVPSFSAVKIALQPDGKLIVGGSSNGSFVVVRYNSNGASLDNTFGVNGVATIPDNPSNLWPHRYGCSDLVIQPDGKIFMVGTESNQGNFINFVIARFNSNGTQDFVRIFDKTDFPNNRYNYGQAVVSQPDGKIVMSGWMMDNDGKRNISLARFTQDGWLDTSAFGTNGKGTVTTLLANFAQSSGALALQTDGKIVTAGSIANGDDVPENLAVARFNSNGTLDNTFGGTGIVITDFGANESVDDLVIQADGKIIVEGTTSSSGTSDFLLARYNGDGSLDTSFGANGKVVTDIGNNADTAMGIALQPDNKIIVIGSSGENAILARYDTGLSNTTQTSLTFKSIESYDGWILESGENSNKGGTLDKVANAIIVGDDARDRQYRSVISFNTNSIPDDVLITSAQVKVKKQGIVGTDPFKTHGDLLLDVRNGTFDNDIALKVADFSAIASAGSSQDKFSASTLNWYTANLSNTNLGFINKYGSTQFRLLFSKDDNDDMGADYVRFFSGSAASTDQPQLIITYSTSSNGTSTNHAPAITSNGGGATANITVPENSTTVTTVIATDAEGQTITYSISGGLDAGKFSITPNTGILTFITAPDFESISSGTIYHVIVQASDGGLNTSQDIAVTVTNVNEYAPEITSNGNINLPENGLAVTTVTATDADQQTLTYSIVGGADAALFSINASDGKLSFVTAPSYNVPKDVGLDNVYNVKVQASDGTLSAQQEISVKILNPNNTNGIVFLHEFGSQSNNGRVPYGTLTLYNGYLYGTTTYGGPPYDVAPTNPANKGNVFRMDWNNPGFKDAEFTVLHEFAGGTNDGWKPWSGLAIANDMIYGSTVYGGPRGENGGVIYQMNINGSGFSVLHAFGEPGDGFGGSTSPTLVGDTLYGLTRWGGNGSGTIYSYNTTTKVYKQLHRFAANSSDGNAPLGTLTAGNDGFLYGLTWMGGKNNMGTLFRIKPDGSAFETMYHFAGGTQGKYPYDSLVFDGSHTFYGTTLGTYGVDLTDLGTIFKYDVTSKKYTVLHKFAGGVNDSGKPNGSVVLSPDGRTLYGTTHGDDAWGGKEFGILYQMYVDGAGFQKLYEFSGGIAGATPMRTPLLLDGELYGMTAYGGTENYGVIYRYHITDVSALRTASVMQSSNLYNPVITSGSGISISENTSAVTTVTATDADIPAQPLTYSIASGADSALFSINSTTGELAFLTAPDYETPKNVGLDNIYKVTVQASDGALATTQDIAVTVTAVNDNAPRVTSIDNFSIPENSTAVTTVTATDADLPTQVLTYSIAGGVDSALFNINSSTGELTFITAPDYELPKDAGLDNIYNVTVQASDGNLVSTQDILITVNAVNDNTPAITSPGNPSTPENSTAVITVTATDADMPAQPLTYSIAGGADSALFNINSSTGELTFITAPDYELPKDAGLDNIYNVTVQASDGNLVGTQDIAITVNAVNDNTPAITSPGNPSTPENSTTVITVAATDADLPAQSLTYSIAGGADSALFNINSSTGELTFITAHDYELPNDANKDNIYNLTVQVSDGTLSTTQEVSISVLAINDNTPVITSPDKFSIAENTLTVTKLTATDADRPTQPLSYTITGGADAAKFSIVTATGELKFIASPDFKKPSDSNLDNIYEIIIQVSDGTYNATKNISVQVTNTDK